MFHFLEQTSLYISEVCFLSPRIFIPMSPSHRDSQHSLAISFLLFQCLCVFCASHIQLLNVLRHLFVLYLFSLTRKLAPWSRSFRISLNAVSPGPRPYNEIKLTLSDRVIQGVCVCVCVQPGSHIRE